MVALVVWSMGCSGDPTPEPPAPAPGPLRVGSARVRMPVPLGIGTVGYGGFTVSADPTPFAEIYPGTTRIHDHPDFRAFALSRGEGFELVFLRSDTVGVFQHLRRAVVLELKERLGRDLDQALVIGATHTHSGPGRVLDAGGPFELIADRFLPEFYDGMVDAMADTVEAALADLRPGRVGTGFAYTDDAHADRRCDDGVDHENGSLPIVAFEQEGELTAVMLAYAVHGTVLGIEDLTLSQDVSGGIEQAVEDTFDHDVLVAQFNAWAADMSPAEDRPVPTQDAAPAPAGYDDMEHTGRLVAEAVSAALPTLTWTDTPELALRTVRVPLSREAIGYTDDEWPYPYGGVYCSAAVEDCDPATVAEGLDHACLPFPSDYPAPDRTELSVGRLGDLAVVTFPGEPGTLLAEQILAEMGEERVLFLGYAQDYTGYSILEDDWWQGGYEASGALWGPRQGAYLSARVGEVWDTFAAGAPATGSLAPIEPFGDSPYTPYAGPAPVGVGQIVADVAGEYGPLDVVTFTVAGADPWYGAPIATLVEASGEGVARPNGRPLTSDGQAFWVELATDPPYADGIDVPSRAFHWKFSMPVRHAVVGASPELLGGYRLEVALPDGAGGTAQVGSALFTVTGS